jgi:hypothetical protein
MKVACSEASSYLSSKPWKYVLFYLSIFLLSGGQSATMLMLILWIASGTVHCAPHWFCSRLSPTGFGMLPAFVSYWCLFYLFFILWHLHSDTYVQAEEGFYFVGDNCSAVLKEKFRSLIGDEEPTPQTVEVVMGRQLQVLEVTYSEWLLFVFIQTPM